MNLQCLNVVAELALPAGRGEVNFAATLWLCDEFAVFECSCRACSAKLVR